MPCPQRSSEGLPIRADLLQARLDSAYALLRLAATQSNGDARRALREARAACREGEQRLKGLRDPNSNAFRASFAGLRRAIQEAAAAPASPPVPARVLQMPARW